MKNKLIYYITITTPIILIFMFDRLQIINTNWVVGLFFLYLFVYRTYVDGLRLAAKGVIPKKDIWKVLIPGTRVKYFSELYLH